MMLTPSETARNWIDDLAARRLLEAPGQLQVLAATLIRVCDASEHCEHDKVAVLARQIRETALEIQGLTAESDPMAELDVA